VFAGIVGGGVFADRLASWAVADWGRGCRSWDEASDRAMAQAMDRVRSVSFQADTRG
jgi:hypothetical protein